MRPLRGPGILLTVWKRYRGVPIGAVARKKLFLPQPYFYVRNPFRLTRGRNFFIIDSATGQDYFRQGGQIGADMKLLRQFSLILLISFGGEVIHFLIPLPIPASVYGLTFMLILLGSGILKTDQVKEASNFLIEIMPVMFIPAGVGLMTSWEALRPVCVPVMVITVLTTIIVMVVTGRVTQAVIRKRGGEK